MIQGERNRETTNELQKNASSYTYLQASLAWMFFFFGSVKPYQRASLSSCLILNTNVLGSLRRGMRVKSNSCATPKGTILTNNTTHERVAVKGKVVDFGVAPKFFESKTGRVVHRTVKDNDITGVNTTNEL